MGGSHCNPPACEDATVPVTVTKRLYRGLPASLREGLPPGLGRWLRGWLLPRLRGLSDGPAAALDDRLWHGFSASARAELATLAAGRGAPAAAAAWSLARWHAALGETDRALAFAEAMRAHHPPSADEPRQVLLEALLLCRLGRRAEARRLLDARLAPAPDRRPADPSAALLRANSFDPAAEPALWLAEVNGLYARFGLSGVAPRNTARPLDLDNLRGAHPASGAGGTLVTVIVPVHNAEATLPTALAALADQNWHDIEILVVDDASTDASAEIAAEAARADPRIRLLRRPENGGPYLCRNAALAEARGALVTVHDADDWSHPDRIRLGVEALAASGRPFTLSEWVRTASSLAFVGPWRPSERLFLRDFSSFLAPRELVRRMGGWDRVRAGADGEMIARLEHLHGLGRTEPILAGCPLAFGRTREGSLTSTAETGVASLYHGVRRAYHESRTLWHASLDPAEVRVRCTPSPPPSPVPLALRPRREAHGHRDLLVIADANRAPVRRRLRPLLEAAHAAGLGTAFFHYPDYHGDPTAPLDPPLRRFAEAAGLTVLAPGEALRTRIVLVLDPELLLHPLDRFPELDLEALVVAPAADRTDEGSGGPTLACRRLRAVFGCEALWLVENPARATALAAHPDWPAPVEALAWDDPRPLIARLAAILALPLPLAASAEA